MTMTALNPHFVDISVNLFYCRFYIVHLAQILHLESKKYTQLNITIHYRG